MQHRQSDLACRQTAQVQNHARPQSTPHFWNTSDTEASQHRAYSDALGLLFGATGETKRREVEGFLGVKRQHVSSKTWQDPSAPSSHLGASESRGHPFRGSLSKGILFVGNFLGNTPSGGLPRLHQGGQVSFRWKAPRRQ